MKRLALIIVSLMFAIGCTSNELHTSKLFVNNKDSGVPNVFFHEDYVTLPCISTFISLGGEYFGQADQNEINILLQGRVFCYDVEKQQLSVRENAEKRVLLPSSEIKDPAFVSWLTAEIIIDQCTLQKILNYAGIDAQIEVDYQEEKITIVTDF